MDTLKDENDRLRRRKEELEVLFEHSNVKDAYNIQKYKVREYHLSTNRQGMLIEISIVGYAYGNESIWSSVWK